MKALHVHGTVPFPPGAKGLHLVTLQSWALQVRVWLPGGDGKPKDVTAAAVIREIWAESDHRDSWVVPAASGAKDALPAGAAWRLDTEGLGADQFYGANGAIAVADASYAGQRAPWFVVPMRKSMRIRFVVEATVDAMDVPRATSDVVVTFALEASYTHGGAAMASDWLQKLFVLPSKRQPLVPGGYEISVATGPAGFVTVAPVETNLDSAWWSERALAMALVEHRRLALSGPGWQGATSNPAEGGLAFALRVRLTPRFAKKPYPTATPDGTELYVVGASFVDQGTGQFCVAAAALFELIRRSPVGYVARTAELWSKRRLPPLAKPWSKDLPTSVTGASGTEMIPRIDWIWMVALRLWALDYGPEAVDLGVNVPSPYDASDHLEAALGADVGWESAVWCEWGESQEANQKLKTGRAVLISAHGPLFDPAKQYKTLGVHTAALVAPILRKPSTGILGDDLYSFEVWSWSRFIPRTKVKEAQFEGWLWGFLW